MLKYKKYCKIKGLRKTGIHGQTYYILAGCLKTPRFCLRLEAILTSPVLVKHRMKRHRPVESKSKRAYEKSYKGLVGNGKFRKYTHKNLRRTASFGNSPQIFTNKHLGFGLRFAFCTRPNDSAAHTFYSAKGPSSSHLRIRERQP